MFFRGILSRVARVLSELHGTVPVAEYSEIAPTLEDGEAVNLRSDAEGNVLVSAANMPELSFDEDGNLKIAGTFSAEPPVGGATEAKQDVQITKLTSIDGKIHTDIDGNILVAGAFEAPEGGATEAKQDTIITKLTSIDGKTPSLGQAAMASSSPVVIASNQTAVPISASSLPLPTTAATEGKQDSIVTKLTSIDGKVPSLGQAAMASSSPVVIASNQTAVPISASSLPLPTTAATEGKQDSIITKLTSIDGKVPSLGQAAMASSAPVVIASNQTAVPISASSLPLPTTAATEGKQDSIITKLTSIDGKVPSLGQAVMASSVPVVLASNQSALPAGVRNTTTPSKSNATLGALEVDIKGSAHVNACCGHWRQIALSSGLATSAASLTEGACDGIRTDTDSLVVYAQPRERPLMASQVGSDWTGAAGWGMVGNVWTHTASGGTGDLEYTPSGISTIIVGNTYCVIFTLVWTSGTSLTPKLGTGAGTARSSSATFVQLITSATNGKIIFTPTNDAQCSIDVSTVYVIPGTPPMTLNVNDPFSCTKIVGCALNATPATPSTTARIWAQWLRRAGASEIA